MGEWVTAVIGLLGAGVGAGAAMWGANRAARMSQEALVVQIRREDERWQRDQRQVAYLAMIRADGLLTKAAHTVSGKEDPQTRRLPPELAAVCAEAYDASNEALAVIELCGPYQVLVAARELWFRAGHMVNVYSEPPREGHISRGADALGEHNRALEAFRAAASDALGFNEPVRSSNFM